MSGMKCRLWWPKQLLLCAPNSDMLLFGWCFHSGHDSVDVVVAAGVAEDEVVGSLFNSDLQIQEALHHINGKMPISLREHSVVSFLGHCTVDLNSEILRTMKNQNKHTFPGNSNGKHHYIRARESQISMTTRDNAVNQQNGQVISRESVDANNRRICSCGCCKLNKILEQHRQSSVISGSWIQLNYGHQGFYWTKAKWVPKLHHMHQNGQLMSICHLHVIVYEPPTFGKHHFSLSSWNSLTQGSPLKTPNWFDELRRRHPAFDLGIIILSLNCSNAAKEALERCLGTKSFPNQISTRSKLTAIIWHFIAVFVASISTLLYIILQLCHRFISCRSQSFPFIVLAKLFRHAWVNVHIRYSQLPYWPVFLQGSGISSHSNVEYAHKVAIRKHAFWSNIAMDILLGNMVSLLLLVHREAIFYWVSVVAGHITNNLLRSGCVWLMGVPAGFKLNTELSELLGMISLNAIQMWSTLWFFMSPAFEYAVFGLALSGMLLGLTVPAALCIDILKLVTLHISALHWLISFIYSIQIQALASLWRLFRGQKWNPLRQRLDSYDYTVEEHVVGSLLFTPVLLLLPTSSVFYIFFTIVNSFVSFICIMIEVMISILHATPHAEILLRMLRRGRFPSGMWFEIISIQSSISSTAPGHSSDFSPLKPRSMSGSHSGISEPTTSVSVLCSNFANIGQILGPLFRKVFHGVFHSGMTHIYGVVSGQRIPSSLQTSLPPMMPRTDLSFRDYWRLCHSSVLGCRS